MLSAAMTDLQQQFEAVRQEAFTAGYATAMNEVKELTARATRDAGEAAVPSPNGRGRGRSPRANGFASPRATRTGRSPMHRSQRGTNALLVAEVLKSASPRPMRAAEIRRALQESGKTMSFPSIGYSLRQLAARNAARQVGASKTWRYSEGVRKRTSGMSPDVSRPVRRR